jgi:hypothetical protein
LDNVMKITCIMQTAPEKNARQAGSTACSKAQSWSRSDPPLREIRSDGTVPLTSRFI